jgi:hypothetical protein
MSGLAQAGVDLGPDVLAARKAQQQAVTFLGPYLAAYRNATDALLAAAPSEFGKQSEALVKATANLQAAQAADTVVQDSAEAALNARITSRVNGYEGQLIAMFSEIVDEHQLDAVAPALPDFTVDGMKLGVLSLNDEQAAAVLAWKAAAGKLHGVWAGYVGLAKFQGFDLGPVGMDSLWTNRLTAVVLGANTSAQSLEAAQVFVASSENVEAAREIRALLPFIAAPIAGFPLQLRPVTEATQRLREFGSVTALGAVSVGV